jgi:hypothetical protein
LDAHFDKRLQTRFEWGLDNGHGLITLANPSRTAASVAELSGSWPAFCKARRTNTNSSSTNPLARVVMMAISAFFGLDLRPGRLGHIHHLDHGALARLVDFGQFVLLGKRFEQYFVVLGVAVTLDAVGAVPGIPVCACMPNPIWMFKQAPRLF